MIFFGTLLAAGLIALGDPGGEWLVWQPDSASAAPPAPLPDPRWAQQTARARSAQ